MDLNKLVGSLKQYRQAGTASRQAVAEKHLDNDIQKVVSDMLNIEAKGYQCSYGTYFESADVLSAVFLQVKSEILAMEGVGYKYIAVTGVIYKLAKKIVSCRLNDHSKSFHARHETKRVKETSDESDEASYESIGRNDPNYACTTLAVDLLTFLPSFTDTEVAALCKVLKETEHANVARMVSQCMTPRQIDKYEKFDTRPDNAFRVAKMRALEKARQLFSTESNQIITLTKSDVTEN
jgi:hypothetical protein